MSNYLTFLKSEYFSNAEVPLAEADPEDRRLRADLAASFQARILVADTSTALSQEMILLNLSHVVDVCY